MYIYGTMHTSLKDRNEMEREKGRGLAQWSGQRLSFEFNGTGHDGVFLALVKDGGLLAAHRGEHCYRRTGRINGRRERIERAPAGGSLARDGARERNGARGSGRIRSRARSFAFTVAGTGCGNLELRGDRVSRHFGCQRIVTVGRPSVNLQMSSQVGLFPECGSGVRRHAQMVGP